MLEWHQDTLPYRVTFGITFFVLFGLLDWWRNPASPKRAREYLFLLFGVVAAVTYGIAHDQLTVTISPVYFRAFKGLEPVNGSLRWPAVLLAVQATYWVGLVAAAVLLIVNNPSRARPQATYAQLARAACGILVCAALGAILGALGSVLAQPPESVRACAGTDPVAQLRFMLVWGMHWGSYAGGACGIVLAGAVTHRRRLRVAT